MADEVPSIFLSHSGKQKPFVEHLYNALLSVNHTAFFDKHTLPKGSPFPPHIDQGARGCKLGVVVLSNDFLTSKWPMLELNLLVQERGPHPKVLPLFYKLHPEDLKSRKKLSKWRRVWVEKAGEHADEWEKSVRYLRSLNGECFIEGTSEIAYIKTVVRNICNLVPSPISYDLSPIQGHQRFAQVVASQFEEAARQRDKVCMVGLYGVAGMGKTTMCKIMTSFYNAYYLGKSYHIEFPSDGDDKKIVQVCTNALKKLTNLSNEHLLNKVDSFDQVVQLMRQNLGRDEMFLAIDNVYKSSVGAAKRILGVSFSANSKILLTSPSEEVLKDLLRGHNSNTCLGPLPSPNRDEAFQIFQKNFELCDLNSSVNTKLLDSALKRCFFSGNYHALALNSFGQYVKSVCALEGLDKIEHSLSQIVQEIGEQTEVEDLIRLNYVDLPEDKKNMFLDIVTVVRPEATYAKAHHWLSILYKFSNSKITNIIHGLALDGLIQLENIDAEKMIRVHDLYSDLAQREAARSPRFLTDGSTRSVKEIKWEKLQRVILRERHLSSHFIEELQQQECGKLQVLYAKNINFGRGIRLDLMPSLCILKLDSGTVRSINWGGVTGLAILHLSDLECARPLEPIPCCQDLIIENMKNVEVGGLSPALKYVEVRRCGALKKMPDMSGLTRLETLELSYNESMEEVGGLSHALKSVEVRGCEALKKMPDLSGLTCLETLELFDNRSMEEVGGLSPALKYVEVRRCGALKKMPDLRGLTCLETLELSCNESMEEVVGGLSPALKVVRINGCGALKKMPDVSGLTCLQSLELEENESMEEVGGENLSCTIESLGIHGCRSLRRFPSLHECVHLEALIARACFINNTGSTSQPAEAQYVIDGECVCVDERLISGVTHLQSLTIKECDSLLKLDVECLPSNLKYLHVNTCKSLEEIGDLNALRSLRTLVLSDCPSLKKLGAFCTPHLQRYVFRCGKLCQPLGL